MPVSEKEIIERLPDWIAEKKTSFLFGSGTSAPGMPLMNMFPGKKDGSTDVDGLMYEIIKRNKFLIGAKMKINVSEEESKAILGTLGAYKKFIEILLDMLGNVNARERHKNINIFTTNYDLFNLKNVDTECKETFALLLSKMLYENKKNDSNCASVHLIIDEAHNILNSFKSTHSDVWEDYRLTTFETMIKEGRKYGFFLTIASQRPADISPTIMSQIHNYIIHKLVNDKDLQMLENTMPTLDAFSKSRIPTLGKGEAVLTGRAFGMPSLIKVDYEEYSRPDSDDVDLIAAWSENPEASK